MGPRRGVVVMRGIVLGFLVALLAAPVAQAGSPWSISESPTKLRVGAATSVTLTVRPGDDKIACVGVYVPDGFTVVSVSVASAPGSSWTATRTHSGANIATFATADPKDQLENSDVARFVIRVIATRKGLDPWVAGAFEDDDGRACGKWVGNPSRPLPPFTSGSAKTPPKPVATVHPATPTPKPKPKPTAAPTISPTVAPSPSHAVGLVTPGDPGPPPPDRGSGTPFDTRALGAGGMVHLDDTQALGMSAVVAWLVPGAVLSLPAVLIVLIVLAQAGFAGAFIPVTRRVLGDRGDRTGRQRIVGS